jgi:RNA polymerase sigma-70 factor (ECF subfamily)
MASDVFGKGVTATLALLTLPVEAAEPASPSPAPGEPGSDSEEGRLLAGALGGDRASWDRLIARHNHKVIVALLARGVLLERARDIAQETWVRLIAGQRGGRLRSLSLPGLAIVQASYLASSEWRRRSRELPPPLAAVEAADPETQLLGREALARLAVALDDCPASARRVFELCYQHPEMSYEEVAGQVGLSTQRVKQIMCEVRKRLRSVLEEVP